MNYSVKKKGSSFDLCELINSKIEVSCMWDYSKCQIIQNEIIQNATEIFIDGL